MRTRALPRSWDFSPEALGRYPSGGVSGSCRTLDTLDGIRFLLDLGHLVGVRSLLDLERTVRGVHIRFLLDVSRVTSRSCCTLGTLRAINFWLNRSCCIIPIGCVAGDVVFLSDLGHFTWCQVLAGSRPLRVVSSSCWILDRSCTMQNLAGSWMSRTVPVLTVSWIDLARCRILLDLGYVSHSAGPCCILDTSHTMQVLAGCLEYDNATPIGCVASHD